MTEPELWKFIESQKTVQVATINRDGTPHLVPLWFGIHDGAIVLETFTKSQKVKNLERDPRITLLFEDGEVYNQLRGAQIYAKAEVSRDFDVVHRMHVVMLTRNSPELGAETIDKVSRGLAPKKTAILVRPEKVVSWDHRKLDVPY
jgi:PPOX class probable F420-dependent enzyme